MRSGHNHGAATTAQGISNFQPANQTSNSLVTRRHSRPSNIIVPAVGGSSCITGGELFVPSIGRSLSPMLQINGPRDTSEAV